MKQITNKSPQQHGLLRRDFMTLMGASATLPLFGCSSVWAQGDSVLPLNTPRVDHLDVIVPDVEATSKFYMGVFNTRLHAQEFRGGKRYFVLLGELPENRQVGYLAIGDSRGRGTYIGHFCTSVFNWRENSKAIMDGISAASVKAGLGEIKSAGGFGGIFADPDGIEIQFLPAPDTLVTAAVPSDLVEYNKGLVTPLGVDHALLKVSDLDKAVTFYRILYGKEAIKEKNPERIWFKIGNTRLGLQQVQGDEKPHIDHFCVQVKPFDKKAVSEGLTKLGAKVVASPDEKDVLRFVDIDGVTAEIIAV